jgi:acetylglutamate kinase
MTADQPEGLVPGQIDPELLEPELAVPEVRAWEELAVVKLGGTTLSDSKAVADISSALERRSLVLVHGGGRRLSEWLERMGIESSFRNGLRITDDRALEVAVAVFGGLVNAELVGRLIAEGVRAVGLTGIDGRMLVARRQPQLGRVAHVEGANPTAIYALLAAGMVPVVAPLALDEDGFICNVNADEVAAGLAGAMDARLVLLTDTDGVLDTAGRRIPQLDELTAEQLITEGVIAGGMVPKVVGALAALRSGATEVVIADGRRDGALPQALGDPSFGTRMRPHADTEAGQ